MVRVENRDVLRLVTGRFMKMNRRRNILAVAAIILTALMFTSLFVGAESLILSRRATEIRQFMSSSHAIVQDLVPSKAAETEAALEGDPDVSRYGRGMFLGSGMNPEFSFSAEVRYADENMAESFNCLPTVGRLPQEEYEIAVSSLVLDSLGIPHQLGEKISVTWEKDPVTGACQTDEFLLCGYWEGDKAVMSQLLFVSEAYADRQCSVPDQAAIENGLYNGSCEYAVWYHSLWGLSGKTERLNREAGLTAQTGAVFEVNPAYNLLSEDSFSFSSLLLLLCFILLAGYLIIYNVFSLSVRTDLRVYGLLKNIGTTGKQLKRVVRMQALRLSAVGIPIGLLAGYAAAVVMAPSLNADTAVSAQDVSASVVVVKANPAVFAAAAFFTLVTVYLSCLQSFRMVERVSPTEAIRLSESYTRLGRRGGRRNGTFCASWYGMAVRNLLRDWKKGLIVMLSLALSMTVVNEIVMLINGYDFGIYEKTFLASDFQLDQMSGSFSTSNFQGVDPGVRRLLEACPYSEAAGYVYYSPETHRMEERLKGVMERFAKEYQVYWNDYENAEWRELQETGKMRVHLLGISEAVFDKLEWKERDCSWEDFSTGKYVIVDYSRDLEEPNSYCLPGDAFHMEYESGAQKNYTVLGEAEMPYALDYPFADIFYITVMIPEEEFQTCTGTDSAMYAAVDAKEGQEEQVQQYLEDTVLKENEMLNVFSILSMRESFQTYLNKYYLIGGLLTGILLCIGVMNFLNTTAASILGRKRELTLLEAVGMTRKQIVRMLVMEGALYFAGAFVIAVLLVCFVSEQLLSHTLGQAFFFRLHLTVWPCVFMSPLFLLIAFYIPCREYRNVSRQSIVERIRVE